MFQSTRPRGARLFPLSYKHSILRCFNPRARVGRDHDFGQIFYFFLLVSIHAPAWGATKHHIPRLNPLLVSIHAPAWGATNLRRSRNTRPVSFNPRARVGRDW